MLGLKSLHALDLAKWTLNGVTALHFQEYIARRLWRSFLAAIHIRPVVSTVYCAVLLQIGWECSLLAAIERLLS